MKKKLLSGIFALALLVATGYGVNQTMKSDSRLSDLALSNVEALAQNENPGGPITISCRYADIASDVWSGTFLWRCQGCSYSICNNISSSSTCTRY